MSSSWLYLASPVRRPNYGASGWTDTRSGGRQHRGMDFRADIGDPVYAVADGVVTVSADISDRNSAGQFIEILHAGNLRSRYMHLSSRLVRKGAAVRQGQLIARTGRSGIKVSAPHLHFDMQIPASELRTWESLFGKPNDGWVKHSLTGRYNVPVEQAIPIDSAAARIVSDAARYGLVMRQDKPIGVAVAAIPVAHGYVEQKPARAAMFLGFTSLALAGAFAFVSLRR